VLRKHPDVSDSFAIAGVVEMNIRPSFEADDAKSIGSYPTILACNHEGKDRDVAEKNNGTDPISRGLEA
jgi:hypothetical protein